MKTSNLLGLWAFLLSAIIGFSVVAQPNSAATASSGMKPLDQTNSLTLAPAASSGSDTVSFDLPIHFDSLSGQGDLGLMADGKPASFVRCDKNPSGNCRLTWNTIYEKAGNHVLQASLTNYGQAANSTLGPPLLYNLHNDHPLYPFPLRPGTTNWNNAPVGDRLASVIISTNWQRTATSWQLYCSVIASPYFRVIWQPGYPIPDCYQASKHGSVPMLNTIEAQADFGANNLRYLSGVDINALESGGCDDDNPCELDYVLVCYMASLDSSLTTMDRPSLQRLFRLAVWEANRFISRGDSSSAAGLVNVMYAIYNKPESFRGALPGVTLPALNSRKTAALAQLGIPPEVIPAVKSAQTALGLTSRP